jgi:hypothetical protein
MFVVATQTIFQLFGGGDWAANPDLCLALTAISPCSVYIISLCFVCHYYTFFMQAFLHCIEI